MWELSKKEKQKNETRKNENKMWELSVYRRGGWRIRGKERRKRFSVLEVPILWRSGKGENKCKLGWQKTPWDEAPGPKEVFVQPA